MHKRVLPFVALVACGALFASGCGIALQTTAAVTTTTTEPVNDYRPPAANAGSTTSTTTTTEPLGQGALPNITAPTTTTTTTTTTAPTTTTTTAPPRLPWCGTLDDINAQGAGLERARDLATFRRHLRQLLGSVRSLDAQAGGEMGRLARGLEAPLADLIETTAEADSVDDAAAQLVELAGRFRSQLQTFIARGTESCGGTPATLDLSPFQR